MEGPRTKNFIEKYIAKQKLNISMVGNKIRNNV